MINAFPVTNVNWIASPTALQQLGEEQFKITPVGAGPFTVVSNQLSSRARAASATRSYFKDGLPYLDKLIFQSIGGDQPAYQALLAGQAQAYEGLNTTPLLEQAQATAGSRWTVQPPTSPYVIQLNTKTAPFNDQRAREAIYRGHRLRRRSHRACSAASTRSARRSPVRAGCSTTQTVEGYPHLRPGAGQGSSSPSSAG